MVRQLILCALVFGGLIQPVPGYNPRTDLSFTAVPYDKKDVNGRYIQDFEREYYFNFHNVVQSAPVYIVVYRDYRGYYNHYEHQVSGAQRVYSTPHMDVYGLQVPLSGGRIVVTERLKPVELRAAHPKAWDVSKKTKPAGFKRIKRRWSKISVSDPISLCINLDRHPVPPTEKTAAGALIPLNDDDDNRNKQADNKDEANQGEDNDLVRLKIQHPPGVPVSLTWDSAIVRLYKTPTKKYKGEYSSLMGNGNVSYKGYDNQIAYAEGISPGTTFLTLSGPGGFKDSLKITVTKIGIAMDGDRDKTISFTDPADTNYVFWVNDDHDVIAKGEEDDAPGSIRDCNDKIISCKRDLEDFTQLYLQVEGTVAKSPGVSYCLRFENAIGLPMVNLFPAINPSLDYIQKSTIAAQQTNLTNIATIGIADSPLSANLLKGGGQPTCLLLEGRNAGKGDLTFLIKQNGRLVMKKSIQLELRPITTFYDKFMVSASGTGDQVNVTSGVENASSYKPEGGQYLLFVHGWNMEEWEKDRWAETVFKRLWWQGYKGKVGLFSWPTLWGFGGYKAVLDSDNYNRSELRAWRSAIALRDCLIMLNNTYPKEVRVLAHSMGNVVVGEALRLGPDNLVHSYLAAQAAISAHMYDAQVTNYWSGWKTPNIYAHYFSGTDSTGPYMADNVKKAGILVRYYNPIDDVLALWRLNNKMKPNRHYNYKGHLYVYDPQARDRFYYDSLMARHDERTLVFEGDRYEIFAFCLQSRSLPLGSESAADTIFRQRLNLRAYLKYGNKRYAHSREFRSNIADEYLFWKAVIHHMSLLKNQL